MHAWVVSEVRRGGKGEDGPRQGARCRQTWLSMRYSLARSRWPGGLMHAWGECVGGRGDGGQGAPKFTRLPHTHFFPPLPSPSIHLPLRSSFLNPLSLLPLDLLSIPWPYRQPSGAPKSARPSELNALFRHRRSPHARLFPPTLWPSPHAPPQSTPLALPICPPLPSPSALPCPPRQVRPSSLAPRSWTRCSTPTPCGRAAVRRVRRPTHCTWRCSRSRRWQQEAW